MMNNEDDTDTGLLIEKEDKKDICDERISKSGGRSVNPTWRNYLIGPVVIVYMACYIMFYHTTLLYVPHFLKEQIYPNESFGNATVQSVCDQNKTSAEYIHQQNIEKDAAHWNIYFSIAGGIPSVVSNIVLGSHTDTIGRKSLLILCCLGLLFNILVSSLGIFQQFSLAYFTIGYVIEGTTGRFINVFLSSFSYIADITREGKSRSFGIVLLELAIGIAVVMASLVTGYYIKANGYMFPCITAAMILVLNIALIQFGLPETVVVKKKEETKSLQQNVTNVFSFFVKESSTGRWKYYVAVAAFFFAALPVLGRTAIETLYQLDEPFCWNSVKIGWFDSLRTALQQICGILLIKGFQRCLSDEIIGAIGSASAVMYTVFIGSARSDVMMYLGKGILILFSVQSSKV